MGKKLPKKVERKSTKNKTSVLIEETHISYVLQNCFKSARIQKIRFSKG